MLGSLVPKRCIVLTLKGRCKRGLFLTFIDKKVQMDHFFNTKEIVFYNNISDLADKINFYAKNDKLRKKIAKNGQKKYFKLFNEKRITEYFVNISIGKNFKLF